MNSADKSIAGQEVEALLGESHPRHAETLFRNTVEDAPVGIAFADREGRYRRCNRAFCAMLGFDTEELKGESMGSLTHSADLESTTAGLERRWSGAGVLGRVSARHLRAQADGSHPAAEPDTARHRHRRTPDRAGCVRRQRSGDAPQLRGGRAVWNSRGGNRPRGPAQPLPPHLPGLSGGWHNTGAA